MNSSEERHRDSLAVMLLVGLALVALVIGVEIFHLNGDPGMPDCPRHVHPATVECAP